MLDERYWTNVSHTVSANVLDYFISGFPDSLSTDELVCLADPSSWRPMTNDELAEFRRNQAQDARAMTPDEIAKWQIQMMTPKYVVDNEMKDKDEPKTGMQDRDIPDNLTELPPLIDDDLSDDKEAQPHKSTISKFFKKLCGIITAIYR